MSNAQESIKELESLIEKLIYEKEFYFSKSGELQEKKRNEIRKKIEKLIKKYRKYEGEKKEEIARILYYLQKSSKSLNIKNYLWKDELYEIIYFAKKADKREILEVLKEYDISQVKAHASWFKFKVDDKRVNLVNCCLHFKTQFERNIYEIDKIIPVNEDVLDNFISCVIYSGKKENKLNEKAKKKNILVRLKLKKERKEESTKYNTAAIEIKNMFKELVKYTEKNSNYIPNIEKEAPLAKNLIEQLSPLAKDLIMKEFLKYDFKKENLRTFEFTMQKSGLSVKNDVRKIVEIVRMPENLYKTLEIVACAVKKR
jgi:hypothetical protein